MIKKFVLTIGALAAGLSALASILYVRNATPIAPAISSAEATNPNRPYVVKLHAQWCPVCMMTGSMWSELEHTYSTRVNFVVFDFTNRSTTETSRTEATRLGLGAVFDDNAGWTGTILVVDGRTKAVTTSIHGSRDVAEYRAAVDAALRSGTK